MKKYITRIYGHSLQSTAMHGQKMIQTIAQDLGYTEVGIACYPIQEDNEIEKEKRIEGMLSSVGKDSLIIAQMPTWNGIAFDRVLLKKLRERAEKLVVFVHDFVPLMFVDNEYLSEAYIEAYNQSDLVILPSEKMEKKLRENGLIPPVLYQEVWDHLSSLDFPERPRFEKTLKFAGDIERFPFVKEWKSPLRLEVFSRGSFPCEGNVYFHDWLFDDQLLRHLHRGGFGLVWSEDIASQHEREYSEMNASYKFSTYLAAGIPLIVNQGLAKQAFVEKYNLGFVCESLQEAQALIDSLSDSAYEEKQGAVQKMGELIREGFFTRKLLIDVQNALYL